MKKDKTNFLVNGEIYLKRQPSFFIDNSFIKKINNIIKKNAENKIHFNLSELQKVIEYIKYINNSYDDTDTFWQAYAIDCNNIFLLNRTSFLENKVEYFSMEELNKDFIKLSDFLKNATFVGRCFRRTKPFVDSNGMLEKNYMNYTTTIGTKYIVLYTSYNLFLVKKVDKIFGDKYLLVNSKYILDGNYEFFGNIFEEYRDIDMTYANVLSYLNNFNKGKGKRK